MKVHSDELRALARRAIQHYGYDDDETEIILDVLVYAQLRGNNQGIVKLIGAGIPKDPEAGEHEIVQETDASALINGHKNAGMVVLKKAVDIALEKVESNGLALVGTFNTSSSTGAIGYYARQMALADVIGVVFSGSPPTVSTHGSYEPLFGTNPVAFGIPSDTEPIVFDMATSAMAWYGLVEAKTAGETILGDVAYDSEGELTTDPASAMDGAILPFDKSYKGAGLSLMVEILTGPLVAASFVGIGDAWGNWGNLVLAMDSGLLVERETFKNNVSKLAKRVRDAKKLDGIDRIYLPGEQGDLQSQQVIAAGEIEIEDELFMELNKVVNEN